MDEEGKRYWLLKTEAGYFNSLVAAASDNGKNVKQHIKNNTLFAEGFNAGDYVVIWYNGVQTINAIYEIQDVDKKTEQWNVTVVEMDDNNCHKLKALDYTCHGEDVILVFDLLTTLANNTAEVYIVNPDNTETKATAADINTTDCIGMHLRVAYLKYKMCVIGTNLKFFAEPFFLAGYHSQAYRSIKPMEDLEHLKRIKSELSNTLTYNEWHEQSKAKPTKPSRPKGKSSNQKGKRKISDDEDDKEEKDAEATVPKETEVKTNKTITRLTNNAGKTTLNEPTPTVPSTEAPITDFPAMGDSDTVLDDPFKSPTKPKSQPATTTTTTTSSTTTTATTSTTSTTRTDDSPKLNSKPTKNTKDTSKNTKKITNKTVEEDESTEPKPKPKKQKPTTKKPKKESKKIVDEYDSDLEILEVIPEQKPPTKKTEPEPKKSKKANLRKGEFVAVRGTGGGIWIAKVRDDHEVNTSKKGYENTDIDILWLIETKEFPGRFMLLEYDEWKDVVTYGSIFKTGLKLEVDTGGLYTVDLNALRKQR